jgi:hypothetical protein
MNATVVVRIVRLFIGDPLLSALTTRALSRDDVIAKTPAP